MKRRIFNHIKGRDQSIFGTLSFIFFISGLVLRISGLGFQSLWNDELASMVKSSYATWWEVLQYGTRPEPHPPVYYTLLYVLRHLIGNDPWAIRFLSAIAGFFSVYGMYLLGKRLYGAAEGAMAAGLTAVLWCPIFYSQEARMYSLMMMFAVFSSLYFLKIVNSAFNDEAIGLKTYVLYLLNAIMCIYTHYFGLGFIVLQGVFAVGLGMRSRRLLVTSFSLGSILFLLFVPWFSIFLEHISNPRAISWIEKPTPQAFYNYLLFLFNHSPVFVWIVLTLWAVWLARYIASVVFLNKGQKIALNRDMLVTLFLILWAVAPILLAYLKSTISYPILTNRNLIVSLPAVYLLVSRSMMRLTSFKSLQVAVILLVVSACFYHLIWVKQYYVKITKEQFREAVDFVVRNDVPQYNALIGYYAWNAKYFDYYFEKQGFAKRSDMVVGRRHHMKILEASLTKRRSKYVWLIYGHRFPHRDLQEYLKKNFQLVKGKYFYGSGAFLYRWNHESGSTETPGPDKEVL